MGRPTATYGDLLAAYDAVGAGQAFRNMVVLDALTLNVDRHMGNHGVLFDSDTLEVMGMAPIFDNNMSFCPWTPLDDPDLVPGYLREVLRPRIGEDFNVIADRALTASERKRVRELGDFRFDRSALARMPEERIEALEALLHEQARALSDPSFEGVGFGFEPEAPVAPMADTKEDAVLMDMALSRLASDGEPIPAEKVYEDLGIDLDEIDAMEDVELSESTGQMIATVEDKEYQSMTTDEMQRLINQQMCEGKSWPQALEVLAEVLNIRPLPEVPNAETLKAMAEARQMLASGKCKTHDSFEELLRDVLGDDCDACYKSYMSFPDGTEVTYSDLRDDGSVGVLIEAPIYGGFKSAHCRIPAFIWDKIEGYSTKEMRDLDELMRNNAPLILRMAKEDAEEEKTSEDVED